MPFLLNLVRKYAKAPDQPQFRPYPRLGRGETRQTVGSVLLYKDAECLLVNDAFPKSSLHCLLLPTDPALQSLNDLTARHVPLLTHMQGVADRYMAFLRQTEPSVYARRRYLTGFHALPSLAPLHMHLLTMDLDSPCLKTKKHYNSFATFFFLAQPRVLGELQQKGYVGINQSVKELRQMEGQPMACMWCGAPLKNMPAVKEHLASCPQNKSLEA